MTESSASIPQKRHFNPYYLSAYYLAFTWLAAIVVLSLDDTAAHNFFLLCQNYGAESLALFFRRYNSMHTYLQEKGDILRWERIVMMLYFCLIGLVAACLIWIKTVMPFLRWWTGTKEVWSRPIPSKTIKAIKKTTIGIACFTLLMTYMEFFSVGYWGYAPERAAIYHIESFNRGFFGLGMTLTIIFLGVQICHFLTYRLYRDKINQQKPS